MTDATRWDEVLGKLNAIKSLSERGGTLAEAEAASAMMAKLLLKYNLTMSDVERHAQQSQQKLTSQHIKTTSANWRYWLLDAVAYGHMCMTIYESYGISTVVGHAHNLIVVREMNLWLTDEINRLCEIAWADLPDDNYYKAWGHPRIWKTSFRKGAVKAIKDAYTRMRDETRREITVEQWALVPAMEAEVSRYFHELFPKIRYSGHHDRLADGAHAAGYAAGSGINLGKQFGASRSLSLKG